MRTLFTQQTEKFSFVKNYAAIRNYLPFFIQSFLVAFIILISSQTYGQQAPSSITVINEVPAKKSVVVKGYGKATEYPTTSFYNLNFGRQNATTDGVNNVITSFVVDGLTYKPIPRVATTPYDNVILKRKANPRATDLGKFTAFYQNNGGVPSAPTSPIPTGTALYFPPEYVGSMESLINSYIVNRGTDNLFANDGGSTLNNIERVDMIITGGVSAGDVVKTGFLLMERGGNDAYKIAAITSLTPSGQVATISNLISAPTTAWGSTGITITSTVLQRNTGDVEIRPNQNITPQPIAGSYISFQSLGIPSKTTIYGIVLFPDDVTSSTDLINLSNVPLNTGAASGIGGLDFMAGGGFFVEEHSTLAFSLSGNIFDDANGLTNSVVDGIGTGIPGGSQLYAYLVGNDNLVKAKDTVTVDGTYVFENQLMGDTTYTVVISTVNFSLADAAPANASLPEGWVITGDSYGNSNLSGSGVQPGTPDLRISVKTEDASITNVNFGIEQLPTAGSGTVTLPNPKETNSATVPSSTFTNTALSSDPDGIVSSIVISYPAANANSITIDATTYTQAQFAVSFPAGATIITDAAGNPGQIIKIDPVDGVTTVIIPFVAIDNAGKKSTNTGTATIIFTDNKPIAVNDVNSTNEDTPVNGTVTGNDTPSGDGGNVWTLVGTNGGASHGTVTMNPDGTYTYTPAANYNGTDVFNYKVCDIDGDCSSATVTITIIPVNDVPLAVNDINSTNEDTPVSGTVTGNDTPSGDGGNVWTLVGTNGGAAHGTVT
ncbi:MAG: cadherin-like domain-containing protein, partial [Ginsengibacter sp.]